MVMTFMKAYTYPTYAKANQLIWFQSTFDPNAVFGHFIQGKSVKTDFGISETRIGTISVFMPKCSPDNVVFKNPIGSDGPFF